MHTGVIIMLILYGTFTIANAEVPKPRNIIFDIVLNKESLWPGFGSSSLGMTADWFSVDASTAEDWTSRWDKSSISFLSI